MAAPPQPHSLGLALLSARAAGALCLQFELDGRGSLEVFPDEAVVTAFEFKSSSAGGGAPLTAACPCASLDASGLRVQGLGCAQLGPTRGMFTPAAQGCGGAMS